MEAAGSKWNFLPFKLGLVGGQCIGVDPYCLTYKAEMVGYQPDVILSGREINNGMGRFIAGKTFRLMIDANIKIKGAHVLVLGLTFKENCGDLRNSRVIDVIEELGRLVSVCQFLTLWQTPKRQKKEYGIDLVDLSQVNQVDTIVAAVPYMGILNLNVSTLAGKAKQGAPFVDVKSAFDRKMLKASGFHVWRL